MMIFTKELLIQLLNPSQSQEAALKFAATLSNTGPAYLDKWKRFIDDQENCWRARESFLGKEKPVKIIIPGFHQLYAKLQELSPNSLEFEFFSALIEHFEVYPWTGSDVDFTENKALSSSAEFWEKRNTFIPATKDQIEKELGAQKISTSDYIILDYEKYCEMWKTIEKKLPLRRQFDNYLNDNVDLTNISLADTEELRRILSSINLDNLKRITLRQFNENELKNLLKLIPKLDEIEITIVEVDGKWLKSEWNNIKGHNLNIILKGDLTGVKLASNDFKKLGLDTENRASLMISAPHTLDNANVKATQLRELTINARTFQHRIDLDNLINLENVTIHTREGLSDISLKKNTKLKSLDLDRGELRELDLTGLTNLDSLKIANAFYLHTIKLEGCQKLKKIELIELIQLDVHEIVKNLAMLPEMEELTLTKTNMDNLDLNKCNNLKFLKYDTSKLKATYVDVSRCTKLTTIKISGDFIKTILVPANSALQTVDISRANLTSLDFLNTCPQLNTLKLENLRELNMLRLKNSSLESIDIQDCHSLTELTVDHPENVKVLTIIGCSNLNKVDLSKFTSLEEVNINQFTPFNIDFSNCKNLKKVCLKFETDEDFRRINLPPLPDLNLEITKLKEMNLSEVNAHTVKVKYISNIQSSKVNTTIKELTMEDCTANNVDITHFPNLKTLTLTHSEVKNNNLSHHMHLEEIKLEYIKNKELHLSDLTKLKKITYPSYYGGHINAVSLSNLPELEEIAFGNFLSSDNTFTITNCPKIKRLRIESDNLKNIDLSQFPLLEELEISSLKDPDIDFSVCPKLKKLFIHNIPDRKKPLDLSNCKELEEVTIRNCSCDLNLSNLSKLQKLTTPYMEPDIEINVTNNINLKSIDVGSAKGKLSMNLKGCSSLLSLKVDAKTVEIPDLEDCKNLRYADFKLFNLDHVIPSLPPDCHAILANPEIHSPLLRGGNENNRAEATDLALLESNLELNQQNEKNPTALFSLSDSHDIHPDAHTKLKKTTYCAEAKAINVTLTANEKVNRHNYRFRIVDEIEEKNSSITFKEVINDHDLQKISNDIPTFTDEDVNEWTKQAQEGRNDILGSISGTLQPDKYLPLPSEHTMDPDNFQLKCNPPNAVELFWHPLHEQYYVKLKDNKATDISLLYLFKKNQTYNNTPNNDFKVDKVNTILPNELRQEINNLPKILEHSKHPLKFIFNEELSLTEKMNLVIKYCDFPQKGEPEFLKLPLAPPKTELEQLLQNILKREGACRHRAQAFMVLARYLGVPARMVYNELHAFGEVPCEDVNGRVSWHGLDFGGQPVLDTTPSHVRKNNIIKESPPKKEPVAVIQELPKALSEKESPPENKNEPAPRKKGPVEGIQEPPNALSEADIQAEKERKAEETYFAHFTDLVQESEVKAVSQLLNKAPLSPLIKLSAKEDPLQVNQAIIKQLETKGKYRDYVYIHRPEDFAFFLHPYRLEKGERKSVKGPLHSILKKGGTIVVNWSNFTATEIASYKSILDTEPTLLGAPVSNKTQVIGLAANGVESCAAFLSRCQQYTLDPEFYNVATKPIPKSNKEPITIDIFNSLNWREKLLGKVIFKGDKIYLEEGPLAKAIREKRPINILNPPVDDDFNVLMHRIRDEHKIIYNGETLTVNAATTVKLSTLEHSMELKNQVFIDAEGKVPANKTPIYLGLFNIHECYELLKVNNKQAENTKGLIDQYKNDTHYFYITESIPSSDWKELLAYIKTNYPKKKFEFVLGPNVEIENYRKNPNSSQPTKVEPNQLKHAAPTIITSNDPDYCTLQYADENAIIIDITPQTQFGDLISEIKIEKDKSNSNKTIFSYQEKKILTALRDGKTVILNGELSPTLYSRLSSLLTSQPPYIYSNGKAEIVKGKLVAIMPTTATNKIQPARYSECQYELKHYAEMYKDPNDAALVKQINTFFTNVNKLPHTGLGRPDPPKLTQKLLSRMVEKLKSGELHKHNPIKGLMLYDYPKNSEDYAYLNVIAKHIFKKDDAAPPRLRKLNELVMLYKINDVESLKAHAWKILNCFRGTELVALLGGDLTTMVDPHSSTPTLTPKALEVLFDRIHSLKNKTIQSDKQFHVMKRLDQLNTLLHDPTNSLIILKGPAGVGKTHTVRELQKKAAFDYFEGEKNIIAWLENKSANPKVLLLDEANMQKPGTWDFLKGLSRAGNKNVIYYKGKEYPLSPLHKIIATANPENYPERYYHPLFQQYAETLYFSMPEDQYLEQYILQDKLKKAGYEDPHYGIYSAALIKTFRLILNYNPTFTYSNRDIENLTQRFIVLMKSGSDKPDSTLLWEAGVAEFAGTIPDIGKREEFIANLAEICGHKIVSIESSNPKLIKITDKCKIHREKVYLLQGIEQDLLLRNYALSQEGQNTYYKQGILLEGDAGLGKSTLLKAILEKNGFSKDAQDPRQRYYEISVGSEKEVEACLLKAFIDGSAVILDELNLDETAEKLINQLLTANINIDNLKFDIDRSNLETSLNEAVKRFVTATGLDLTDSQLLVVKDIFAKKSASQEELKPKPKGFLIFSSQNPSYFAGRKSLSRALCNRMVMRYMDPYSKTALIDIAEDAGISFPRAFVNAFERCRRAKPHITNMRTFYTCIGIIKKLLSKILPIDLLKKPEENPTPDVIQPWLANTTKRLYNYLNRPLVSTDRRKSANSILSKIRELSNQDSPISLLKTINAELFNSLEEDFSKHYFRSGKSRYRRTLIEIKKELFAACPATERDKVIKHEIQHVIDCLNLEKEKKIYKDAALDRLIVQLTTDNNDKNYKAGLLHATYGMQNLSKHKKYNTRKASLPEIHTHLPNLCNIVFAEQIEKPYLEAIKSIGTQLDSRAFVKPKTFFFSATKYPLPQRKDFLDILHNIKNPTEKYVMSQAMIAIQEILEIQSNASNIKFSCPDKNNPTCVNVNFDLYTSTSSKTRFSLGFKPDFSEKMFELVVDNTAEKIQELQHTQIRSI